MKLKKSIEDFTSQLKKSQSKQIMKNMKAAHKRDR
jgi:hypothetical protein